MSSTGCGTTIGIGPDACLGQAKAPAPKRESRAVNLYVSIVEHLEGAIQELEQVAAELGVWERTPPKPQEEGHVVPLAQIVNNAPSMIAECSERIRILAGNIRGGLI
jgi:hypothetical protein